MSVCVYIKWIDGPMMMIMMDYDHNITGQECALNIVAIGVVACYIFFALDSQEYIELV